MAVQTKSKKTIIDRHLPSSTYNNSTDVSTNSNISRNYGFEPPWLVMFRRIKKEAKKMSKHFNEKGMGADYLGTLLLLALSLAIITITVLFQYFLR